MSDYPEHDKLRKISQESQTCGEFLDWLRDEEHVHLVECVKLAGYDREQPMPYRGNTNEILAKFFNIDLDKIEEEKRAMLDSIRNLEHA